MRFEDKVGRGQGESIQMGLRQSFEDQFKGVSGQLRIVMHEYEGDKRVNSYEAFNEQNLIVNTARTALANLIANGNPLFVVDEIALGDGHHLAGDILTPITPVITETALENELFRKSLAGFTFPDVTSVEFNVLIERLEANGAGVQPYTEYALFFPSGMFSIKSAPALVKHDDVEIEFFWKIIF